MLARRVAALLLTVVTLVASRQARADSPPEPPEKGAREIPYSFQVKGLGAAPDQVLFAYWCESDKAVTHVLTKLEEGVSVPVKYRGGNCALHAIEKAKYDEWAKSYDPRSEHRLEHPQLKKLVDSARKCQGGPTPTFATSTKDKRASFEETLTVTTLNATSCVVTTSGAPVPMPPSKGCGGCDVTQPPSGGAALLVAACVLAIRIRRRQPGAGSSAGSSAPRARGRRCR